MKSIILVFLILFFAPSTNFPQVNDYWKNAPVDGSKIFYICFTNEQNGFAISENNELFISADKGSTWKFEEEISAVSKLGNHKILWSADIYCSVMKTTDGGLSWLPYSGKKQEHFCRVYLKDPNVGYKTASEFLNKVSQEIFKNIKNKDSSSLIDHPKQCTEYYSDEEEGWAVGWCLKNLKVKGFQNKKKYD